MVWWDRYFWLGLGDAKKWLAEQKVPLLPLVSDQTNLVALQCLYEYLKLQNVED